MLQKIENISLAEETLTSNTRIECNPNQATEKKKIRVKY
jgi:hypothetical protein